MLSLISLFSIAEVAADAVPAAGDDTSWWKMGFAALLGIVIVRVVSWLSDWLTGSGQTKIVGAVIKAQETVDKTSIGSQIAADNAIFDIIEKCIPDVMAVASADLKKSLADGKMTKGEWEQLGALLWAAAKPHIQGGTHDYLANSSFKDGAAIATLIAKRFFTKKEEGGTK